MDSVNCVPISATHLYWPQVNLVTKLAVFARNRIMNDEFVFNSQVGMGSK